MKSYKYICIFFILINLWHNYANAQTDYNSSVVTDTIAINFNNHYEISQVNILPNTEQIFLKGKLLPSSEYNFIYSKGYFTLSDSLPYSIFDTLIVSYRTLKLSLRKEYSHRNLVLKYDEKTGDTLRVASKVGGGFTPESIFGSGIQKSGSIVRGFTVGTTKDFSLNSGLRLQMSGRISEDIEIVAALTDENTPIQPEGNTERLEELDKVFIQVKHPNVTGTFGDYQLKQKYGEFGVIDRKLQGLTAEFSISDVNGYAAVATSRGKFNTNSFNGTDATQGPYYLTGANSENNIIIIAGTEKVYVDGVEMKRGENNDYTIEYSNATITFTTNRLITSASRINVDFEYTDRNFSRNLFAVGSQGKLFNDKLQIKFQYIREGDDQDAPIDISLSDDDKKILAQAGDDEDKAIKSGVSLTEPDSLGEINGIYTKVDTLISDTTFSYYVYAPGDSLSLYDVSFTYVGSQKGDYSKLSSGYYKFVGIGQGSYLPIIKLPMPELKQMANLVVDINPFENVTLSLEYAGSSWDKNRLSDLDDGDNYGYARNILLKVLPSSIKIGDINLGKAGLSYRDRFVEGKFTSIDRYNDVEFTRNYNLTSVDSTDDQSLREIGLTLQPINEISLSSTAGFLRSGDDFESDRLNNIVKISDQKNYGIDYNLDYVKSSTTSLKSKWWRHKANGYYTLWKIKSGVEFEAEDKTEKNSGSDSLTSNSLKYFDYAPYLQLKDFGGFDLSLQYSLRDDYLPDSGIMIKESRSVTPSMELNYKGLKEFSSDLTLTYRSKKYEDAYIQKGYLNNETILIRSNSKFSFWEPLLNGNFYYEVSTQKSARLEKVFVRVEQGTGTYKYLGDLNSDGIADENEFELTSYDGDYVQVTLPTDELYPVIYLKTSTRWKTNFSRLFDQNSLAGKILKPISTETYWRVEENSTETDYAKIYLLNFSSFQNENTTINGSNYIQQDVYLFENQQDLSFRIRFTQKKSLTEYSSGYERDFTRERSLRIKFKMIQEMSNQTDIVNEIDNASAPSSSNNNRKIVSNSVTSDFSYRPERNIEVGFKLKAGRSEDSYPENPTIIDQNSQTIRLNISFLGTGRLRIEIERNELNANTTENYIPYEMTNGSVIGKNYYWTLNFDYRLTSFLQTTVSYNGRVQGVGKVVHTAKAEARAYF